jgi:hypothetical protein
MPRFPVGTVVRVGVVLCLFTAAAIAIEGGWERIQAALRDHDWQFDAGAALVAALLMVGASVWLGVVWYLIGKAFGASLGLGSAIRIYSQSNLGKYLPGKVFHAVARVYMAQQQGVPVAMATTMVAIDVVMYVGASLLIIVVALPLVLFAMLRRATDSGIAPVDESLVTIVAAIGLVAAFAMLHPRIMNLCFRVANKVLPKREFPQIEAKYTTMLGIFALYLSLWGMYTASFYSSVLAVHPITPSSFLTLGAIYALSYLAGLIVPIAPAGLGVRDGLMVVLLGQLIPYPAAVVASVLSRLLQVAAEFLCAAAFSRS